MKTIKALLIAIALLFVPALLPAQTALSSTTLSAAINNSQACFGLASVTGLNTSTANATGGTSTTLGTQAALYVDRELEYVQSINTTAKTVCVLRGMGGSIASAHASGSVVIIGPPAAFLDYDPAGYCGTATPPSAGAPPLYTPWVNQRTSNQWLCGLNSQWVPGFGNPGVSGTPPGPTTASAISSNAITPSGPIIHVTGTTILKTITLPSTYTDGPITLIFDGSGSGLQWDATGNIGVAGTATTAGSAVTFTYDRSLATPKWIPSRLA